MNTDTVLQQCRDAGVLLAVRHDGKLIATPSERITDELRSGIQSCKGELLERLTVRDPSPVPPVPGKISTPLPHCGNRQWSYQHACWHDEL